MGGVANAIGLGSGVLEVVVGGHDQIGAMSTPETSNLDEPPDHFCFSISHHTAHNNDNIAKPVHGVFNHGVSSRITFFSPSGANSSFRQSNGRWNYTFSFPNAGWEGGFRGSGRALHNITVIVQPDGRVWTAYPN